MALLLGGQLCPRADHVGTVRKAFRNAPRHLRSAIEIPDLDEGHEVVRIELRPARALVLRQRGEIFQSVHVFASRHPRARPQRQRIRVFALGREGLRCPTLRFFRIAALQGVAGERQHPAHVSGLAPGRRFEGFPALGRRQLADLLFFGFDQSRHGGNRKDRGLRHAREQQDLESGPDLRLQVGLRIAAKPALDFQETIESRPGVGRLFRPRLGQRQSHEALAQDDRLVERAEGRNPKLVDGFDIMPGGIGVLTSAQALVVKFIGARGAEQ